MLGAGRRIRRTRTGQFELRLPAPEREALRSLPGQLRDLLGSDDPALDRLFPAASRDDPQLAREFRELTHDELLRGKLGSVEVMEATIDAERLDREQVSAWLGALNDLRLVLGTRLGVTEEERGEDLDPRNPLAAAFALYHYLTFLQDQVIEALASELEAGGGR